MTTNQLVLLLAASSLKTTAVLLAAFALVGLLRRNSAALRHWVLTLALLATLMLPILSIISPVWSLAILPGGGGVATTGSLIDQTILFDGPSNRTIEASKLAASKEAATVSSGNRSNLAADVPVKLAAPAASTPDVISSSARISGAAVVLLIWLIGAALLLARWIGQCWLVAGVTRRAFPANIDWHRLLDDQAGQMRLRRRVRLVFSAEVDIPMTWGFRQPIIVLPLAAANWDETRGSVVLRHEMAHILRRDYLTQWLLLVSCSLNWFNPVIWFVMRRITLEREQASDDLVLNSGVRSVEYAAHLLAIAHSALMRQPLHMVGLAMAQRSDLEQRIRGILNKNQARAVSKKLRLLTLTALVALLLPLGGMRLSQVNAQGNGITLSLAVESDLAEGIRDQGLLNDFLAAHPGVAVNLVNNQDIPDPADDLNTYFNNLQKYAGSADVLAVNGYNLGLSPLATRAGALLNLMPLIQSDPENLQNDFYPQLWSSYQWDGGMWALPISADMVVMVYDTGAFDQAGLPYPDGSWSLDQFVSTATKLVAKDANGNVIRGGFANSGRIFREALWRSLFTDDAFDTSTIPNTPQFERPDVQAVIGAYHQLEQQNIITSDVSTAAMYVDSARNMPDTGHAWALLPGDRGVLLPYGFAVSAGTQQPQLAYDLVKYLTSLSVLASPIPARKSTTPPEGIANFVLPAYQPLIQQGFDHALTLSNLRLSDYLNDGQWTTDNVQDTLQSVQAQAVSDLQAADARRSTLSVTIVEPVAPTVPPGKIALNFDLLGQAPRDANQAAWSQVVKDFDASDPQVGLVNLRALQEPASVAAQKSDCFYSSSNIAPTMTDGSLLDLAPLLNADPNFDPNDFISGVLASVQRGGQTLALPLDIQPIVLRYSPELFSAANLPMPTNDWTTETFIDALTHLQAVTQGQAPLVDNGSDGAYLLLLIASDGGLPIDFRTSPPTINFTDPASVDAIRQVLDLARSGVIRYTTLGDFGATMPAAPGEFTALYPALWNNFGRKTPPGQTPDQPVLFPRGSHYNGIAYDLGAGYISAQSQNPEACYRFLSTLAQHPELFSAMPARHSQLTDPAFTASTDPTVLAIYQAVDTRLQDPNTIAFTEFGNGVAVASNLLVEHWLFKAFDNYVLNNADLTSALQDAQNSAAAYTTCAANLPPLDLTGMKPSGSSAALPYVDCAEQVDSSLKPFLDPLVGR